jgi:hypothetical protein
MRKLLILTCCVGLASLVGAAQNNNNNNNNQGKKKGQGQGQPQQQAVMPQQGKKFQQGGAGPHHQNFQQSNTVGNQQNFQQMNKHGKNKGQFSGQNQTNLNTQQSFKQGKNKGQNQNNISGNAANTSFGKGKFGKANPNAGQMKFQKKQFNLQQANNKNYVINKYKTVNYNKNYKFVGWNGGNPYNWGPNYVVFANYHPLWHDSWWWNWHHPHLTFIFGGWYYWDNSYWYPAWGYAPSSVYVYDGPIYASSPAEDPGQVVANVQSALQQQGYYQGDIDGILGPQTRAALAEYQSAQGLQPTGAVDEPTLETLGMA